MKKEILARFYAKYKTIIFPILVGAAGLSLTVLVIIPQIRGYFNSKEDEVVTQNRLKILEVKAQELEGISKDDLSRKVRVATVALPIEKDYTTVFGLLQRLSAEAGVNLESVNLDTEGVKDSIGASNFSVKIAINANNLSLDEFFKKIENTPTVLNVGSLTTDITSDNLLSSSLSLDVYFSPAPKTLGGIDSPLPELTTEEEILISKLEQALAVAPVTSTSEQPSTLLPRGKPNPFE